MLSLVIQFLISVTLVQCVVVNPLPKPVSIEWATNSSAKIFDLGIELICEDANDILLDQFYDVIETIRTIKWYPEVTDGPRATFPATPQGPTKRAGTPELRELYINLATVDAPLEFGINESYHLVVDDEKIVIDAGTTWGALHALKTLQQLVIYKDNEFKIEQSVEIHDEPILTHRGVLVDSARNWLSLDAIKTNIDLMSLAKLNVMHWHLVDTQSWPVEIKAYPEMTGDAYSSSKTYTHNDIKHIIEYAYRRGIRVIPEVDLPGHSRAGYRLIDPELVSCGDGWWNWGIAVQPPGGQLDVAYNKTYDVVETVFDELTDLFTDNYFHVGHDELQKGCYNFSNNVWEWYATHSNEDFYDLIQFWVDKSIPIFTKNESTRLIMWEDIITSENATIPKDKVLLQVWLDSNSVKTLSSQGFDVIVSSSDSLYLDCGFGSYVTNDTKKFTRGCDPYKTWQKIYSYDMYANLTETEKTHVVGAEVVLWSEQVDSNNLVQKIWTRSAAFAESAWSGNKAEDGTIRDYDMTQRIFNYREYLVALGHPVSPFVPEYCITRPHSCDRQIYVQ